MDKKELKKIIERLKNVKIDERLKEDLLHLIDNLSKKKKFGLSWDSEKDPEDVVVECINKMPVLKNIKNKTVKKKRNNQNNILIEGDNYHALQVLNQTHMGKVDVVYIDPPYNTGIDGWRYNDRIVNSKDGYRHSKWLNMMEKRLSLAKKLLNETGAIFISIDDNEQANLKLLCDEIFSEKNFLGIFIWESKLTGGHDSKHINTVHEYVLCYAKNSEVENVTNKRQTQTEYPHFDEKIKRYFKWDSLWTVSHGYTRNCDYPITAPDGSAIYPWMCHRDYDKVKNIARWFWSKETFESTPIDDISIKKSGGRWKVYKKIFGGSSVAFKSVFEKELVGGTSHGKNQLEMMFGRINVFDNPKPTSLLKHLFEIASTKESIILDFFAGSGTTGHAVLELNKEDGGNRQFILCTNNENKIAEEVTYPRIKKVIEGYKKNGDGDKVEGLGGGLHYYRTDFVDIDINAINDNDKLKVSRKIGYVLGIKNNCYEEIEFNDHYQVFENADEGTGTFIYFEEDLSKFDDFIKSIKGKKGIVYLYSGGTKKAFGLSGKEYKDIKLEKIPERFLSVYKDCIS